MLGSWVELGGTRFGLAPGDVWHQVEAVQSGGRLSVRVGGVLRSSRPASVFATGPRIASDGDVAARTVSSYLEDGAVHGLPGSSSYVSRWGGSGAIELAVAVRGSIELALDGTSHELEGDAERYRLVRLTHEGAVDEIVATARSDGAAVTDLFVYARA